MRLFGYYAWHTVKNQIRRLFQTWVAVLIIACLLFGAAIGVGAVMIEEWLGADAPAEDVLPEEDIPMTPQEKAQMFSVIELAVGGFLLLSMLFACFRAEKSGAAVFLPADVSLLFASPLRPQSVLLFRLMAQIGGILVLGVYLMFQVPNLMINLGLHWTVALAVLFAFVLTVFMMQVLSVFVHLLLSASTRAKKMMRPILYTLVGAVVMAFLLFQNQVGTDWLDAADGFFNAPASRFVPLWGWIKGIVLFAAEGNGLYALLCAVLSVLVIALMMWGSWRMKADFYEEAMYRADEIAAQAAVAQSGNTATRRRKKDRADKLLRDGLKHGKGASVYFFKGIYNRRRFAWLGIFSKTTLFYLVVATVISVICRFALGSESLLAGNFLYVVGVALGGFAFFRSLGNPVGEDISQPYFRAIPESGHAKLFYAMASGTVISAVDLAPALLLSSLLLWESPLVALALLFFVLSVDFYSSSVAVFLDLSLPGINKNIKAVIQILFIYFGLLPLAAMPVIGAMLGRFALFLFFTALAAALIGAAFFIACPFFF